MHQIIFSFYSCNRKEWYNSKCCALIELTRGLIANKYSISIKMSASGSQIGKIFHFFYRYMYGIVYLLVTLVPIGNVHKPTRSTKKVQLDVTILNYHNSWRSLNGRNIALTKQYSIWYLHQMLSELSELSELSVLSCVCHRCCIFHYHTPIVLATCCHLHIMSILGQIMTLIATCLKCKQNI